MNIGNLDFETDFTSGSEIEEMLDGLTSLIGEQAEIEDNTSAVVNPSKIQAVLYTYKVLKYMTKDKRAKVTYELHKPYKSMGSVSVTGKDLVFNNSKWFMIAVKLASNFNVYPKTNGTVRMDFTFHGLTTILE